MLGRCFIYASDGSFVLSRGPLTSSPTPSPSVPPCTTKHSVHHGELDGNYTCNDLHNYNPGRYGCDTRTMMELNCFKCGICFALTSAPTLASTLVATLAPTLAPMLAQTPNEDAMYLSFGLLAELVAIVAVCAYSGCGCGGGKALVQIRRTCTVEKCQLVIIRLEGTLLL